MYFNMKVMRNSLSKQIFLNIFSRKFSNSNILGVSFELSDTSRKLKERTKNFVKEEIIPKAAICDKIGEYPQDIIKKAHEMGILNSYIPANFGGANLSTFDGCLIIEEFGYGCGAFATMAFASNMGQIPVIIAGNDEQKKKYLGRCISEPILTAYCYSEPSTGSDISAIKTKAEKKGDEYVISGQKMWISNGGIADWYFLATKTNFEPKTPISKALTGFIVEKDTPGIIIGRKEVNMGIRASDTRSIIFEDVRIPKENVLGAEGQGFKIAMKTFDKSRVEVGAAAVGIAQRCLDEALKYSLERIAFGIPIAEHQAIAFILADMAIGIETARLTCYKAADEQDRNLGRNTYYASVAKALASDVVNKCANNAVQVFGCRGLNTDYPVEKLMRDAKIFQIFEGTSQIQRIMISRSILENNG